MNIFDLELLFFLVSITANVVLAITVLLYAKERVSRLLFLFFVCAQVFWATANYLTFIFQDLQYFLWASRLTLFFATFHTFAFFLFVYLAFEISEKNKFANKFAFFLFCATTIVAALTLSPFVFENIIISSTGDFLPIIGPAMPIFGLFDSALLLCGLYILIRRFRTSSGEQKTQLKFMLIGLVFTVLLILVLIIVSFLAFGNLTYIKYGHIYTLPFVVLAAYAIVKHNLFNTKIIATQAFVTIISIVFLARIFVSSSNSDRAVDIIIFISTLFFGILLVRSVLLEIKTREEVRSLAKRLGETNWELARTNEQLRIIDQRKSEFVSIVSHQLRTPVTAIKGYASMILEESFGKIPDELRKPVEKIFISSRRVAEMISDFLDISKIEQGSMEYRFSSVNICALITDLTSEFLPVADKAGLVLTLNCPVDAEYIVTADEGKIRQIFSNIIDNAIKYTVKGGVHISLERNIVTGTILIKFKDTGIGLSQDDIHHLFGKFTRGIDGQRQNTSGSGLGLYVASKMLEAMRGRMWVDSPGPGLGATFIVELLSGD